MKENQLTFGAFAIIEFISGQFDDEEIHHVDISSGHELFEKLQLFYEGKYEELFGFPVFDVRINGIEYHTEQKGIEFSLKIGTDDAAQAVITFHKQTLHDENAKKIALIREIIDYDPEAEYSLLRETFGK